ncbi:hypothetical protein CI102_12177 [Trichoderma harzianum]|nr:hypothetical protein CI102_12177 [Trichoderma harzianum]
MLHDAVTSQNAMKQQADFVMDLTHCLSFLFWVFLCNLSASCSRGGKYRWRPKTPIPALRRSFASALMLQVCCYIQPAEITSARPRFCARVRSQSHRQTAVCILWSVLLDDFTRSTCLEANAVT